MPQLQARSLGVQHVLPGGGEVKVVTRLWKPLRQLRNVGCMLIEESTEGNKLPTDKTKLQIIAGITGDRSCGTKM